MLSISVCSEDKNSKGEDLTIALPSMAGIQLVSLQQGNALLEEEKLDVRITQAAKLLHDDYDYYYNVPVGTLDSSCIEEMLRANHLKMIVPLLRSKVELLLFSLFLLFTILSSISLAFIIVALTKNYLIIDPYSMLFGVLGFLGLALTAWQAMKKRAMI